MNELNWNEQIQWQDVSGPLADLEETRYTLTMKDFLRMPDIDYLELAQYDPQIRSLLN